jgi:Tol biopolymer transport system component
MVGMKISFVVLATTICAAVTLSAQSARNQSSQSVEAVFGAALHQQEVEGDLAAAAALYKKVLADPRANAELRAKAQAQLDRIERQTSKWPSARAAGDGVIQRFLKTGRNVGVFTPSPDGRYLAFHNWETNGNLAIHDLATGVERDITRDSPWQSDSGPSQFPIFTPDSKKIVYATRIANVPELLIIGVDGSGMRTILRNEEYRYVSDHGISPDGNTVSVLLALDDQTWQIALVSLDSGNVRVLKTIGWARPAVGNFSANGRWIVYSVPTQDASSTNHEVYAIAVDGSAEFRIAPAIASDTTPYFSPDGSRVVFVGQRLGQRILWSVRVADGRPTAAPEVLKTDVGAPMGFTADGSLYFGEDSFRISVFTAEADPLNWKATNAPKEISNPLRHSFAVDPAWSPDGTLLAYSVPSASTASKTAYAMQLESTYSKSTTIVIRDRVSGQERELVVQGGRLRGWFSDSHSLLVDAGPAGLRVIEIGTGEQRNLIDKEVALSAASINGRAIFYYVRDSGSSSQPGKRRPGVDTVRVLRRDVATDEETELCRLEAARGVITDLSPSPDGSHVAFIALLPSGGARLFVVSSSGGPLREVQRPSGTLAGGFAWAGDSRALLFVRDPEEPTKGRQVWAVPIDGGASYATGIEASGLYSLSVHPDGHVAFTGSVREADQISVLDGLFPKRSRN